MPNSKYLKSLSEEGRRKARIRWDREERRIQAEMPRRLYETEKKRVLNESIGEEGIWIGTLEWRDHTGKVRKWVIRRGPRFNQLWVDGMKKPKCVTWMMARLRERLSCYFRGAST